MFLGSDCFYFAKKKPTELLSPVGHNTNSQDIYFGITLDACGPFCPMLFSNSTS